MSCHNHQSVLRFLLKLVIEFHEFHVFYCFFSGTEVTVKVGVQGDMVGTEEEVHFTIGDAGNIMVRVGLFGQVEEMVGFASGKEVPELRKDFVDGLDIFQVPVRPVCV